MEWGINALTDWELSERVKLPEWAKEDEAPIEVSSRDIMLRSNLISVDKAIESEHEEGGSTIIK